MESFIDLAGVTKIYKGQAGSVTVLEALDLQIEKGEFVAMMGPSGSGKTTLLNILGGLDRPTGGTVRVGEQRIDALSSSELSRWRSQNVGFIFQFYNLMPVLTALQNVQLPLLLTRMKASERMRRAQIALDLVGLAERSEHRPAELSGGQQQRVAIARAIVADPQLLICDEPTGDLDRQSASDVLELLQSLSRDHGKTIVMVTHDAKAAEYAATTHHLEKGRLLEAPAATA